MPTTNNKAIKGFTMDIWNVSVEEDILFNQNLVELLKKVDRTSTINDDKMMSIMNECCELTAVHRIAAFPTIDELFNYCLVKQLINCQNYYDKLVFIQSKNSTIECSENNIITLEHHTSTHNLNLKMNQQMNKEAIKIVTNRLELLEKLNLASEIILN